MRVLIDNGVTINILPSRMLKVLGKNEDDLVPIGIVVNSFLGIVTLAKGVLPIELTIGTRKNASIFFVVDS